MPTTSYTTPTMSAATLGARTNASGTAVTDLSAEENRLVTEALTPGYFNGANAFRVQAQSTPDMTVKVGSGSSKTDIFVLGGTVAGQGNYAVRLDVASQNITIDAADASQTRTDEVYVVVRDNAYDSSGLVIPQLAYRKGDLGGANPGPDATWKAYGLAGRVTVPAGATSITSARINDGVRVRASLDPQLAANFVATTLFLAKGDLVSASAAASPASVPSGADGNVLRADSTLTAGVGFSDLNVAKTIAVVSPFVTTSSTTVDVPATLNGSSLVASGLNGCYIFEARLVVYAEIGTRALVRLGISSDADGNINIEGLGNLTDSTTADQRYYQSINVPYGSGTTASFAIGRGQGARTEVLIRASMAFFSGGVFGVQVGSQTAGNSVTVDSRSYLRWTRYY